MGYRVYAYTSSQFAFFSCDKHPEQNQPRETKLYFATVHLRETMAGAQPETEEETTEEDAA